ncbi:MAG: hypothetical protein ABGX45_03780 [Candidatus Thioglobus sp.]|jgi:hypothetical protein
MNIDHYTCPFSHLILSGRCGCQYGAKDCIAEKEFGTCLHKEASVECQSLYHHLRDNSDFVLKAHYQSSLSVGQQSKIKMGGLLALQEILNHSNAKGIDNITELVALTKQTYGSFEKIPFSQLMPKISKFKFRDRS